LWTDLDALSGAAPGTSEHNRFRWHLVWPKDVLWPRGGEIKCEEARREFMYLDRVGAECMKGDGKRVGEEQVHWRREERNWDT